MKSLKIAFQLSLLFLLTCYCFSSHLLGQTDKKIEDLPDECEIISAKLEIIGDKFKKDAKEGSYLIIIASSPRNIKTKYNNTRISDAVKFLTKFKSVENKKIVFGTTESSNKLAYLRFYINGELVDEIKTMGKGRICSEIGETFNP